MRRALAIASLALLLGGCGSSSRPPRSTRATVGGTPSAAPRAPSPAPAAPAPSPAPAGSAGVVEAYRGFIGDVHFGRYASACAALDTATRAAAGGGDPARCPQGVAAAAHRSSAAALDRGLLQALALLQSARIEVSAGRATISGTLVAVLEGGRWLLDGVRLG